MNEQNITQHTQDAALTDDELRLVVGGSGDSIKPIEGMGDDIERGKATPILM